MNKMFLDIRRLLLIICLLIGGTACSDDGYGNLIFIGDSHVERWDLAVFFPTRDVTNLGKYGAGISWIESHAGMGVGQTIVVMIGTNDVVNLPWDQFDKYAERYVNALMDLNAEHLMLFPILPRCAAGDSDDMIERIGEINGKIKSKVEKTIISYINVYDTFLKENNLNMDYSYDGLHLNDAGYEVLSEALKKEMG